MPRQRGTTTFTTITAFTTLTISGPADVVIFVVVVIFVPAVDPVQRTSPQSICAT
jgi:hypothetical protein